MNTVLPQHNPLLKGLYVLLLVFMFGFFGYILVTGDIYVGYSTYSESEAVKQDIPIANSSVSKNKARNEVDKESLDAEAVIPQPNITKKSGEHVTHINGFKVVGVAKQLNLSGNISEQITALWHQLYDKRVTQDIKDINNPRKIYAVYTKLDVVTNRVRMTLGYKIPIESSLPSSVASAEVASGFYEDYAGNTKTQSVLQLWSKQAARIDLNFKNDFEEHAINHSFQPVSAIIYLGKNK